MDIDIYHSTSKGNLYRANNLLIDPGVPFDRLQKDLNFQLHKVAGCLISHSHADHSKAVKGLLKAGTDCYMNEETGHELGVSGHRVHIIEPLKQFEVYDYKIMAFSLVHDVSNMGFLIAKGKERLLYCTDTNYIPFRFKGLTHVLIGISYDIDVLRYNIRKGNIDFEVGKRVIRNHMSIDTALSFFRANDMSKVQGIYLLHLSEWNSNAERFKGEIEKITGRPVYLP